MEVPTAACPACGFSLEQSQKAFAFSPPALQLLLDPSNLLPPGITKEMGRAYRKLRRRVPQVDISFCFVSLQPATSLEAFAFWLHNTAPAADTQRAWQLLVVGDRNSGRLTMTSGYALEPFLKPELWEAALQELAACLSDEQWKEGLNGFLVDARELLTSAWHVAEQRRPRNHGWSSSPSKSAPQVRPEQLQHASSSYPASPPENTPTRATGGARALLPAEATPESNSPHAERQPATHPS